MKVFDNSRMQNIAIVMRGIFGQMPSVQEPRLRHFSRGVSLEMAVVFTHTLML